MSPRVLIWTFCATMLKAMTSLPCRKPVKVMKSPTWKGAIASGSGAVLRRKQILVHLLSTAVVGEVY